MLLRALGCYCCLLVEAYWFTAADLMAATPRALVRLMLILDLVVLVACDYDYVDWSAIDILATDPIPCVRGGSERCVINLF